MAVSKATATVPEAAPASSTAVSPMGLASTQPHTPTQLSPKTVQVYETLLHRALLESNRIAEVDILSPLDENDVEITRQIATAEMLNYCVRMLHADGWHPPTILRAMALRESGLERGIRGTMYQALRERRTEIEMFKTTRMASSMGAGSAGGSMSASMSPSSKSSGGSDGVGNHRNARGARRGHGHGHGHGHAGRGGAAMRGRHHGHRHSNGHGHGQNVVYTHPNPHPHPQYPVAIDPNTILGIHTLGLTPTKTNPGSASIQPLRSGPAIADSAIMGGSGGQVRDTEAVELI